MPSIHLVTEEETASAVITGVSVSPGRVWRYSAVSASLVAALGTWLVWFSAFIRQILQEEDIQDVCQRAMPETAD